MSGKALWIFENMKEVVDTLPDKWRGSCWKMIIEYAFGDDLVEQKCKKMQVARTFKAIKPLIRLRGIAGSQNGKSNNPTGLPKNTEPNIGANIGANPYITKTETETETVIKENKVDKSTLKESEDFNIFWEAYTPVKASDGYVVAKGSKKVAFEKYSRIIKSGVKPEDILKGLKAYIDFCQKNNRLTCGVPVFLNQERWKDEYNTPTVIAQPNILSLSARERQDLINKQKTEALLKKLREQGN